VPAIDSLVLFLLLRSAVRKIPDRGTAEADARQGIVGIVGAGFTHPIIIRTGQQTATIVVSSRIDIGGRQDDFVELAAISVGPLDFAAIRVGVTGHLASQIIIGRGRVGLAGDRQGLGRLATGLVVGIGDGIAVSTTDRRQHPTRIVVGERIAIGDRSRGAVGGCAVITLGQPTGQVVFVSTRIAELVLLAQHPPDRVIGEVDLVVGALAQRAAVARIRFGEFVPRIVVGVAGDTAFRIGQRGQVAGGGVGEQGFAPQAIGLFDLAPARVERVAGRLALGIGAGDLVSGRVVAAGGHAATGIGTGRIAAQGIVDTVLADVIGVTDRELVTGGIVGVAGNFAQRVGRLDRSSDGVGVGLLDLAQGVDLFGDQVGFRANRFGRIVPGTVPRDQRRVTRVEDPAHHTAAGGVRDREANFAGGGEVVASEEVATAFDHHLCNYFLATHRIERDDRPLQFHHVKQLRMPKH